MAKPFTKWTVLPHGPLVRVDTNLMTVVGTLEMPLGAVERRMTIARLTDGRLVVYSAIALDEAKMAALEAFGVPSFLVVPNELHRMDAKIWKERYPRLKVIAPSGARAKVEEIVAVDATDLDVNDPHVRFVTVPGTGDRESALIISTEAGTTLVLNDLIFNLSTRPGFKGWLFEKLGMTGDAPHMPPLIERREVKDKAVLSAQLEQWSHLPRLKRVLVSHGPIIDREPAEVLHRVAQELAA